MKGCSQEVFYEVFEEDLVNPEIGQYRTYGIMSASADGELRISDVSLCKDKLEDIVGKLNMYELSPVHIRDVVEDILAGA